MRQQEGKNRKKGRKTKRINDILNSSPVSKIRRIRTRKIEVYEQSESLDQEKHVNTQKKKPIKNSSSSKTAEKSSIAYPSTVKKRESKAIQVNAQSQNQRINEDNQIDNQIKIEEQSFDKNDDSGQYLTPVKRKKRQIKNPAERQIFFAEKFNVVEEEDFIMYVDILAKTKMFSIMMTNQFGQIIYADRLASEHFEGSLNNFQRNPLYSMILQSQLQEFYQKIKSPDFENPKLVKVIIYSKNSKRRYSKATNQVLLSNNDIFNRYLKCLSCQIIPIQITLSKLEDYQGFWSTNLAKSNEPFKCYLFKTRLARMLPSLDNLNLEDDKKIQKFINYTLKKKALKPNDIEANSHSQVNDNFMDRNPIPNEKAEWKHHSENAENKFNEQIFEQMNEEIKHSKSALTRNWNMNQQIENQTVIKNTDFPNQ